MVFGRDTLDALRAAAALINTLPGRSHDGADHLTSFADVEAWMEDFPYTGHIRREDDEARAIAGIRPRLERLWEVERNEAVPLVNAMLRDGQALPQLVIHDGYDWHVHATHDSDEFATRILVEAAMAFVEVIRSDNYQRMRTCEAEDCNAVYVDFSKNGSKRYCDTGNCGNRMNVIAYRRRKAAESA